MSASTSVWSNWSIALASLWIPAVVNLIGVRQMAWFQNLTVVLTFAPLLFCVSSTGSRRSSSGTPVSHDHPQDRRPPRDRRGHRPRRDRSGRLRHRRSRHRHSTRAWSGVETGLRPVPAHTSQPVG
ncbi:MAG: hypothetical protein GEV10_14540 [Streptosporangiales bacterium]|nr:hypothetical protein [Streptosporangiales bacterium]